ncbi:hypothetical protein ADK96_27770 [Streptomyces sp. IGB124]|nr:hypothetical protein ADK96_27770 [Streptomyces sp. IGB124]
MAARAVAVAGDAQAGEFARAGGGQQRDDGHERDGEQGDGDGHDIPARSCTGLTWTVASRADWHCAFQGARGRWETRCFPPIGLSR